LHSLWSTVGGPAAYLQLLGGAAAEDAGWRARLTVAGDAHASDGVDDLRETKGCG
jgi:hypothetical protein